MSITVADITRTHAVSGFTMSDYTAYSLVDIIDTLSNLPADMCKVHAAAADHFLTYDVMSMARKGAFNPQRVNNLMLAAASHIDNVNAVPVRTTHRQGTYARKRAAYRYAHKDCK